ncbi:Pseudouridine synthase family protein [Perilla frutescens var. hirtella]|uniref:Pseudouridine synthase family protein n=1 Tax=Perilla frutescens var. hirtella TaxID=608512 RepID=A0AAD4ITR2_PERFH|nr:Pseudouridine synthase family protein [Perilla frutescens var. frutescens]KAH6799870.1 Pseudouridine synthase family protein [Perilla frutescens var. hirtella]KAH6821390.1 Pseudouridine synthase family protein [Perilla frutescens var. hirtella]
MAADSPPPPPPPPEEQPDPKRQKMSTTTTSDEENPENAAAIPRTPKYKRRKVAIFFAYCGVGYQGMQKNPGAKTIEGDFEEALYRAGAVPEEDRGMPRRFDWARSARTDKGVSAVGQVVSGRFYVDPPGFVERLNSHLAPQIRVFGYKRATPSFNAKKFCDRRRYVYLVPVFALDPSCHRDRESVMASVGSGNELVKCVECSERGRKVFGVMGKRSFESKIVGDGVEVGSGISSNSRGELVENNNVGNETGTNDSEHNSSIENGNVEAPKIEELELVKEDSDETGVLADKIVLNSSEKGILDAGIDNASGEKDDKLECDDASIPAKMEKKSEFCYGEAEKERFNRILKYYEGTHNFHNFTTRTKAEDPAAKRYILSFNANTVLDIDGIKFIKCEVVGQSFMLHQIRKMIGLAVAVMRNCSDESLVEKAFEQKVNINVPMAPEVGLYLDECFFSSYNHKWKDTHEELSMKAYAEEAEAFKMKYIYPHIASTEHKDGSVAVWLHSLNYRNYPDLRPADSTPIPDQKEAGEDCPVSEVKDEVTSMDE